MPAAVTTTVTELPESRVRLDAQVSPQELEQRMQQTARSLGREMKMPGFRKGKVPTQVVIQRMGRESVLDETIRQSLGRWYVEALGESGVSPVGDPDLKLGDLPAAGEPLTLTIEIGVLPLAQLGTYKGLQVSRREAAADDETIDAELAQLQERMAKLETVEEAAASGDFVVMDYVGSVDGEEFDGGTGSDQVIELGSGRLIPGFEDQLTGTCAGDERTVEVSFPDDYGAEHLAGKAAEFDVTVKEVRRKLVPDLDDTFASDAAGFDTLAELREDVATRVREMDEQRADAEFREAVMEAVAAEATVELPEALVEARAKELLDRMLHQLEHQGINREMYLQISGKSEEDLIADGRGDAETSLMHESVLAAIVESEGIEPSDGDILDALQASAMRENLTPEKLREKLEKAGRMDDLIDDLAARAAIEFITEHAVAVPAAPVEPAKPEPDALADDDEAAADDADAATDDD